MTAAIASCRSGDDAARASWRRCRVQFARNALAHAGKSGRRGVAAAFTQNDAEAAGQQWRKVADRDLAERPAHRSGDRHHSHSEQPQRYRPWVGRSGALGLAPPYAWAREQFSVAAGGYASFDDIPPSASNELQIHRQRMASGPIWVGNALERRHFLVGAA